jgi:hypothetical protein
VYGPYEAIYDRLSADPGLSAVATGGVWKRPLVRPAPAGRPANPGQTAGAFDADLRVKPSVVLADEGEGEDPTGPDTASAGFPLVWFYAPPTETGKATIASMWGVAEGLLHGWHFAAGTGGGTGAVTRVVGRLGTRDAPDDFPAVVDFMRLHLVFLRRATG